MKKIITAAALVAASVTAHAQFYGEVGYSVDSTKLTGSNVQETKPKALRALVGYDFNENFALEGIVGFGIGEANVKTNGATVSGDKAKLNNVVGLYLTPKVEVIDGLTASLRLGVARSNTKFKGTFSDTEITTSTSYGIGVSYLIDSQISINADYMVYGADNFNNKSLESKGFTIGAGYKF